jgi:cellulose synthase/poly-beta-1,6-N-acetylglucosamine synthase-like glycosyltransferase
MMQFVLIIFWIAFAGILSVFIINPIIIWLQYCLKGEKTIKKANQSPFISIIISVHNGEKSIKNKLLNTLSLNYPKNKLEIIVYSDGSTDSTNTVLSEFMTHQNIHILSDSVQKGKNACLNQAVTAAKGEILVFSDVDAILDNNTLQKLITPFADNKVCGICGNLIVGLDAKLIANAQHNYFKIDSRLKLMESRIGSITSNLGVLYAIRRNCFKPFADGIADDLYACINILLQHKRFVYEPEAIVFTPATSKDWHHELIRRKRIVCGSLECLRLNREIFNPLRYGMISVRLFINKIMRRLLPINLILLFISSIFLIKTHIFFMLIALGQIVFYLFAAIHPFMRLSHCTHSKIYNMLAQLTGIAYYFVIGNLGTLLGLTAFIRGKKIIAWHTVE